MLLTCKKPEPGSVCRVFLNRSWEFDCELSDDGQFRNFLMIVIAKSSIKMKGTNSQPYRYINSIQNSSSIIFSEKYPMYSLNTIKKFNINFSPPSSLSKFIDNLCKYGKIDILEYLLKKNGSLLYSLSALEYASQNGHVNVLEWWKNSKLSFNYDEKVLKLASSNGHINVLDWWKNSGLPLKYYDNVLDYYHSNDGDIKVLEWWRNSGLPFQYYSI